MTLTYRMMAGPEAGHLTTDVEQYIRWLSKLEGALIFFGLVWVGMWMFIGAGAVAGAFLMGLL